MFSITIRTPNGTLTRSGFTDQYAAEQAAALWRHQSNVTTAFVN
jgi:hypothetical protein